MIAPFRFATTPNIVFEDGAAARLGDYAGGWLGARILVVTDAGLVRLGLVEPALASLRATGARVTVFDAVEADPSRATVEAAALAAKGCTGVVGFGGGSSLDVAKLAALLAGSGRPLDEAFGVNNATGPRLALALVPTTAGTGSEVTPISIVTVDGETKMGVVSPVILPDMALLDPSLTVGLPGAVTAATGIDAMVHAIEAITSASANNNPISQTLAERALSLLGANIERAVHHGADVDARAAMLLGSMLAGQAFANSPVAAVHALAYPIGGRFHVPHGLSNALVLPHVLRFNAPACDYGPMARLVFEGGDAKTFPDRLDALARSLGLDTRLRGQGIAFEDCASMAVEAMKQTRLLVNNPREVTQADAQAIYEAAW